MTWTQHALLWHPLTFLACWCVFVRWLLIFFLAPQITSIDGHSCFNLLLGQFHPLIKHLEEFLWLVVPRQTMVEWSLKKNMKMQDTLYKTQLAKTKWKQENTTVGLHSSSLQPSASCLKFYVLEHFRTWQDACYSLQWLMGDNFILQQNINAKH